MHALFKGFEINVFSFFYSISKCMYELVQVSVITSTEEMINLTLNPFM